MKRTTPLLLILSAFLAQQANAQDDWTPRVWVDYGRAENLTRACCFLDGPDSNHTQPGIGIGLDHQIGLTFELGYYRGEYAALLPLVIPDDFPTFSMESSRVLWLTSGWDWQLGASDWYFGARGGIHRTSTRSYFESGWVSTRDATLGTQLSYRINDKVEAGITWQRFYDFVDSLDRTALRLTYRF